MKWDKQAKMYKKAAQVKLHEEKIKETILKSKSAFLMAEQEKVLSYREFLWIQLKVIKKRWWVLQSLILLALWVALVTVNDEVYIQRSMGIVATLFVILVIPELWKNRSCGCMEIEATSYYSLKQVYAARMLLFGITDLFLVTLFLGIVSTRLNFELLELMIQFLVPLCVTACICFGVLCSRYFLNETVVIILCVLWSSVWLFIVLNESIYPMIAIWVWFVLLGVTILFLIFSIYRILKNCDNYLEVAFDEIRIE